MFSHYFPTSTSTFCSNFQINCRKLVKLNACLRDGLSASINSNHHFDWATWKIFCEKSFRLKIPFSWMQINIELRQIFVCKCFEGWKCSTTNFSSSFTSLCLIFVYYLQNKFYYSGVIKLQLRLKSSWFARHACIIENVNETFKRKKFCLQRIFVLFFIVAKKWFKNEMRKFFIMFWIQIWYVDNKPQNQYFEYKNLPSKWIEF